MVPYTKAKERFFPSPEPGTPDDVKLLQEIRDLLAPQGGGSTTTPATPTTCRSSVRHRGGASQPWWGGTWPRSHRSRGVVLLGRRLGLALVLRGLGQYVAEDRRQAPATLRTPTRRPARSEVSVRSSAIRLPSRVSGAEAVGEVVGGLGLLLLAVLRVLGHAGDVLGVERARQASPCAARRRS